MEEITDGVMFYNVDVGGTGPGLPMKLRIYLPKGRAEAKSLPCVFIAPAGATFTGLHFADEDTPEHIPYAKVGFAVVAYEVSGELTPEAKEKPTYENLIPLIKEFVRTDGGLKNGKMAIDYALSKMPEVDPQRLYSVGHSSAALQSLNLCRGDSRIQLCCAYAPVIDIENRAKDTKLADYVPGLAEFCAYKSCLRHIDEYNKPIFLFHADDDSGISLADTMQFVDAMNKANKPLTFKQVKTGDHYDSMINEGIPGGIQFLIDHGARPQPPIP